MNTLSILLYLANVLPSVAMFLGVVSFTCLGAYIATKVITYIAHAENRDSSYSPRKAERAEAYFNSKDPFLNPWVVAGLLSVFLFSHLIPSERTIYLIAASEMGEVVVTDPETVEIFDLLKETVKTKLEEVVESE